MISNLVKNKYNGTEISDASKLDFLISEVSPSTNGASELSNGTSTDSYINSVISQQRAVAKNDGVSKVANPLRLMFLLIEVIIFVVRNAPPIIAHK